MYSEYAINDNNDYFFINFAKWLGFRVCICYTKAAIEADSIKSLDS